MRIVENEQISQICYISVCKEWQKDRCNSLGFPYIHGNIEHHTTQVMVPVNLCPSSTVRIVADGNCFFRSLSFVLTGSQDYHQEVRLLVTTYMIDNTGNPALLKMVKEWKTTLNSQRCSYWVHGQQKLKSSLQPCYFKLQSMSMDLVERVTSGKSMHLKVKKKQTFITMNAFTLLRYPTILKLLKRCNSVLMRIKCAFVVCINSFNTEPITDHVHRTFGDLCK